MKRLLFEQLVQEEQIDLSTRLALFHFMNSSSRETLDKALLDNSVTTV